jgi:hypothetical protein
VLVGLADELGARRITFDRQAHEHIATVGLSVDLGKGLPTDW